MMALPLVAANAQPLAGPYISLGGGVNFMQQETVKSVGGVSVGSTHLQLNDGATAVLTGGWGFGNGLRAEVEFDYRWNGLNQVTSPKGNFGVRGQEQKYGPMVNALYDFYGLTPMLVPYVGAGVGYQAAALHASYAGASDTKGDFAYQAIVGAAVPIPSMPAVAVTAEYRFLGLSGDRTYSGVKLRDDYNHSIMLGVRYSFGAPPPPAPAPMPVADMGAKTFLVFFDWDKADLTARSQGIVHDAADYSTHNQYTRIDVDGNTDTSGTPQYNMGLSERRARVVASELVRDGVPQSAISMHAYGDTKLLVPTGPGVREPQNRRVEIVFH
jgi:outer membrane protein OmpA-like peptidoglycan-associated protein